MITDNCRQLKSHTDVTDMFTVLFYCPVRSLDSYVLPLLRLLHHRMLVADFPRMMEAAAQLLLADQRQKEQWLKIHQNITFSCWHGNWGLLLALREFMILLKKVKPPYLSLSSPPLPSPCSKLHNRDTIHQKQHSPLPKTSLHLYCVCSSPIVRRDCFFRCLSALTNVGISPKECYCDIGITIGL